MRIYAASLHSPAGASIRNRARWQIYTVMMRHKCRAPCRRPSAPYGVPVKLK